MSMTLPIDLKQLLKDVIQIGIALSSERDLPTLLALILTEARRFMRAEAGTLFLRDGEFLKFSVVQNEVLSRRLGEDEMRKRLGGGPLPLEMPSLAGYVAQTGETLNIPDAYAIPRDRLYSFNQQFDMHQQYRTQSVLLIPLQEPSGSVIGVLQLINALDEHGTAIPFDAEYEDLIRLLASHAAVAIRNARLEELSFRDTLTEAYNRRYLMLRLEEELKRVRRHPQPLSLVLLDLDKFKEINDHFGHNVGDEVLRQVAHLLVNQSRQYAIVSRYGGDEFATLLVNTPKAGAVAYAERLKRIMERYPFPNGQVTTSVGVACLPDDVAVGEELIGTADKALYQAKRAGRNAVGVL